MDHRFKTPSLDDHTNSGKQLFVCVRKGCGYSNPAPTKFDMCQGECDHAASMPKFDKIAAEGLGSYEVRERWPRFMGNCAECGQMVILYESFEHYLMGDW